MKIYTIPGLERYKKIFQRVAQKYLDHLNHRSLMAGKLSDLLVVIGYGENDIPTEILIKLAKFYNVSVDYILERTDNPKTNK